MDHRTKLLMMRPIAKNGEHMTIKEFAECVEQGLFNDYDGHLEMATDTEVSNMAMKVSDFVMFYAALKTAWTHVVWYNK